MKSERKRERDVYRKKEDFRKRERKRQREIELGKIFRERDREKETGRLREAQRYVHNLLL